VIQWTDELRLVVNEIRAMRPKVSGLYLFVTREGTPYTGDGFRAIWQRAMKKALTSSELKERFTEHDIRAKTGTDADAMGLSAKDMLMHDSEATTKRYLRHKTPVKITPLR